METNNQNQVKEYAWDAVIPEEDIKDEFTLLPDGDYEFSIAKIERSRFQPTDSSKMKEACPMAIVHILISNPATGNDVELQQRLFLIPRLSWQIAQLFDSIGTHKKGTPLQLNWNIIGKTGMVKVNHREYNGNTFNNIQKFISAEDANKKANYVPGTF